MKTLKKFGFLSLTALLLAACGGNSGNEPEPGAKSYVREDEDTVYDRALGEYNRLLTLAKEESTSDSERYVMYAKAEANLLQSGVLCVTTTDGGTYAMTRIAPRTVSTVTWGNDADRLENTRIANEFIRSEDRAAMLAEWKEASDDQTFDYDAKAWLLAHDYTINNKYGSSFSTFPETLDMLNTSSQADTESVCNAIEGLYKYDEYLRRRPAIAVGEPVISADGKTYTFTLRDDVKWVTNNKDVVRSVTAQDFVDGFEHMLDCGAGLESLVFGVIENAYEYVARSANQEWFEENVGFKALDDTHLQIKLCQPESFFLTRLNYSIFMPMNSTIFEARGGAYGVKEFKAASAKDTYTYADPEDPASMYYNSAYVPTTLTKDSVIVYEANPAYYNASNVTTTELKWVYDEFKNPTASYNTCVSGGYTGIGLGKASGLLDKAKEDGNYALYAYVTETNATTYFGGVNLNRGTFDNSSENSEDQYYTHKAVNNLKFRQAMQAAFDRVTWNATTAGAEVAALSIRNMYNSPDFVITSEDVTFQDHLFPAGTTYGKLVEWFLAADYGIEVDIADGHDAWFNAARAKTLLAQAKAELQAAGDWKGPIKFELIYWSGNPNMTAKANAYKQVIEANINADPNNKDVVVELYETETLADFYKYGYRTKKGVEGCYELFYNSGWGPDYGDPSTYLDTFLPDGDGYMTKVIGLY